MDFQTRFVLCSAPVFLRGRAFPILPPQTSLQSISRCRASSSYALHIQAGVCKLVSTNILYSIRYPRSCQAPRIAFKIISDDFSRLLYGSKKRAEPAFTSAEVRHTSKSCSRGRFYAISYTLKKRAEPAFTSAEVCHTSKSCSRGRFYAISYTLKKRALRGGIRSYQGDVRADALKPA